MARRLNSDLAEKYRLPAIYPFRSFAEAGGLRAYGIDFPQRALGMTENQAAATGASLTGCSQRGDGLADQRQRPRKRCGFRSA